MKTLSVSIFAIALAFYLSSCREREEDDFKDDTTTQTQQSSDESMMTNESEVSINEVNIALSGTGFGKTGSIAGATIDTSLMNEKKIVITYNGNSADNRRTRTGKITLQLTNGTNWGEVGAVLTITYDNFKVLHIASGKSVVFNGQHLITNITGGRSFLVPSVTHIVRGNMNVVFDGGRSLSWQIARRRVSTAVGTIYSVTISGDTTVNGINNAAVWGMNRNATMFYTQISTPILFSSTCVNGPTSGVKVHKGIAREITVTFGVDAAGNPISSSCPYGFKLNWTNLRNEAKTAVISY